MLHFTFTFYYYLVSLILYDSKLNIIGYGQKIHFRMSHITLTAIFTILC